MMHFSMTLIYEDQLSISGTNIFLTVLTSSLWLRQSLRINKLN